MRMDQIKELEDRLAAAASELDEIDALNALASELVVGNIDRADQLAQRAFELSRSMDNNGMPYKKGLAFSLSILGSIAKIQCDYRMALSRLLEAQVLLESLHEQGELLNLLINLGWVYFSIGDFPQSIQILHKALRIARECGDTGLEAKIFNALGAVYGESGDKEESIDALLRALKYMEGMETDRLRFSILNNLAMTQLEMQAFDAALESTNESTNIAQNLGSPDLLATVLDTTGQIYLARKEYQKAEGFFNQAQSYFQGEGNDPDEHKLNLARAAIGQGRLDEAAIWLNQSLESVERHGVNRFTYQVHELLAGIYDEKGELQNAIKHYKLFHDIKSQFFNEETHRRLGNMIVSQQVETTRIDAEIYRLKNQALCQEISTHNQTVAEMEILATTDSLTGLLNRRHFMTLSGYAFESVRQAGQPLAALMIDIDDFKNVNDRFGHLAGDQVLMEVTATIQASLRKEDLFGRLGGEEFAAILPRTEMFAVQKAAERILNNVAKNTTWIGSQNIQITLSIGIAQAGPADDSLEKLLDRADKAMYAAKRSGKNRIIISWADDPSLK